MARDPNDYFPVIFTAFCDRKASCLSAASSVFETQSATLHQDFWSILTHADYGLAALASEAAITASSDPLGPGKTFPRS